MLSVILPHLFGYRQCTMLYDLYSISILQFANHSPLMVYPKKVNIYAKNLNLPEQFLYI